MKKPLTVMAAFIQEKRGDISKMDGVNGAGDVNKKAEEIFNQLPLTEKVAQIKRFDEEMRAYNDWCASAEGGAALQAAEQAKQERVMQREAKAAAAAAKAGEESRKKSMEQVRLAKKGIVSNDALGDAAGSKADVHKPMKRPASWKDVSSEKEATSHEQEEVPKKPLPESEAMVMRTEKKAVAEEKKAAAKAQKEAEKAERQAKQENKRAEKEEQLARKESEKAQQLAQKESDKQTTLANKEQEVAKKEAEKAQQLAKKESDKETQRVSKEQQLAMKDLVKATELLKSLNKKRKELGAFAKKAAADSVKKARIAAAAEAKQSAAVKRAEEGQAQADALLASIAAAKAIADTNDKAFAIETSHVHSDAAPNKAAEAPRGAFAKEAAKALPKKVDRAEVQAKTMKKPAAAKVDMDGSKSGCMDLSSQVELGLALGDATGGKKRDVEDDSKNQGEGDINEVKNRRRSAAAKTAQKGADEVGDQDKDLKVVPEEKGAEQEVEKGIETSSKTVELPVASGQKIKKQLAAEKISEARVAREEGQVVSPVSPVAKKGPGRGSIGGSASVPASSSTPAKEGEATTPAPKKMRGHGGGKNAVSSSSPQNEAQSDKKIPRGTPAVGEPAAKKAKKAGNASPAANEHEAPKDVATPAKTVIRGATTASIAKKVRGQGQVLTLQKPTGELNAKVLGEAQTLGYEVALRDLASRREVADRSAQDLLIALKKSKGLVNPARNFLLDVD